MSLYGNNQPMDTSPITLNRSTFSSELNDLWRLASSSDDAFNDDHDDVSDSVADVFYIVMYDVISSCVCLLGIATNSLNLLIFAKQGFQETVNVTFFAMALSDLASVVTLLYLNISFNPLLQTADLDFIPIEVQVLFGGWPHVMFLRVTAWLTAFISMEQCCCVIFPLKVKTIFSLAKVKVAIGVIYVLVLGSMAPTYYYTRLGWRFVPERNKSLLGLTYTEDRAEVERISYLINSVVSPIGYFTVLVISTAILVVNLNRKSKWRQQVSSVKCDVAGEAKVSSKDKKIVKMVVTIATIFVAFLVPSNVVFVWQSIEPELYILGKYKNLFKVVASCTMTLEAVNSSVNAFVYYNMSSNYRLVFRSVVLRKPPTTK